MGFFFTMNRKTETGKEKLLTSLNTTFDLNSMCANDGYLLMSVYLQNKITCSRKQKKTSSH